MFKSQLWVNIIDVYILIMDEGWGDTHTQIHKQTHRHNNTMTRPGLGAGPSENRIETSLDTQILNLQEHTAIHFNYCILALVKIKIRNAFEP